MKEPPATLGCICDPPRRSFGVMDRMITALLDNGSRYLIHYDCQPDDIKAAIDERMATQATDIVEGDNLLTPCKCGEPNRYGVHRPTGCDWF